MELLIWICGVIVGAVLTAVVFSKMRVGTLYIVESHLESEPQLLCNLDRPIETFMKKRRVMMTVDHINTRE